MTIGEKLKEAREKKGLSFQDIQDAIRSEKNILSTGKQ